MHDTKMKRKVKIIVNGISRKIFRRIALESGPTVHLEGGPMTVSENYPAIHLGVVQCIYQNSVVSFREQKAFVLKTVFLLAFGLGMCKGVGEDSRHGIGHVDIQVGSCICLSVIVCHDMCTQVGSNPCRRLSLLGFAHHVKGSLFQVQRVYRRTTLTRGHV